MMLATQAACSSAFIYQPAVGQIWDPSVLYWDGSFFAISMYSPKGNKQYPSGFLSRSADGAHWQDLGPIAPSQPNFQWWKGFVLPRPDGTFVLNHGVYEAHGGNDALRILTSTDLRNWTTVATSKPDARWYKPTRWDHMFTKPDPAVKGGYIGFPVSEPLNATKYASTWPGVQRSPDGVAWTASAPLDVRWGGGVAPQGIEEGGIERLMLPDGSFRYFLIGGQGGGGGCYQMWSFVSDADDIMGPYSPTQRRFRMSGGLGGWGTCYSFGGLGAWVAGPTKTGAAKSGPLISQYITPGGGSAGRLDVWMLPMRAPVAAQMADGTPFLRLGYWPGNDVLLGAPLAPPPKPTAAVSCAGSAAGYGVAWVAELDAAAHSTGAYLLANLSATGEGAVGLAIEYPGSAESTAIVLTVGVDSDDDARASNATILHVDMHGKPTVIDTAGAFACGGKGGNATCGVASVTAVVPGAAAMHTVRLFVRRGMFEVYIDELLVTSHVYRYTANASGRVGLACIGAASASLADAKVGRLDLGQ